jgi:hypothetical protein
VDLKGDSFYTKGMIRIKPDILEKLMGPTEYSDKDGEDS